MIVLEEGLTVTGGLESRRGREQRMDGSQPVVVELRWQGPFAWPGMAGSRRVTGLESAEVAGSCGVYVWTVEHEGGFLVYAAGETRRPFRVRFREHTREYRSGRYTVFNAAAMKRGERKKVWPGFWYSKQRRQALEQEYSQRSSEIARALDELLSSYRVLVAPLPPERRLLQRVEGAIMAALYAAIGPAAVLPDRGMALAPRWPSEAPIRVRSISPVLIHGLPDELEV